MFLRNFQFKSKRMQYKSILYIYMYIYNMYIKNCVYIYINTYTYIYICTYYLCIYIYIFKPSTNHRSHILLDTSVTMLLKDIANGHTRTRYLEYLES